MRRSDLEHIIRAAAGVTGENEFIVIGSQAILGQYPEAPEALLVSMEADLYAAKRPDLSELISGSLGWESPFDTTFGYHADGVGPDTATLPAGWEDRLTEIRNAGYIEPATLNRRLQETVLKPKVRTVVAGRIRRDLSRHQQRPGRGIGD